MSDEPKEKKLSAKVEKLVEEISTLSVLDLAEMVKAPQEKLGVSAMPVAAPAAAPAASGEQASAESTAGANQTVIMTNSGGNKIAVIKALREINPNLGLKEAKDMTEQCPAEIVKDAKAEDAKAAGDKLTAAGATVELK